MPQTVRQRRGAPPPRAMDDRRRRSASSSAIAVALVISFATAGHKSGHGCISVGLAYSTGGAQIYRCGASARALCASVSQPGGTTGGAARSLTHRVPQGRAPVG